MTNCGIRLPLYGRRNMIDLIGKVVEVVTPETTYIGKLVEINEDEVYLETDAGWVVVPIEKIADIREPED